MQKMLSVRCILRPTLSPPVKQIVIRSIRTKPTTKRTPSITESLIDFFFHRNLVFTNTLTSGAFMGISEFLIQQYEYTVGLSSKIHDAPRTARMTAVGACLGFLHHYYYIYLDRLLPKVSLRNVFTKIFGDQFFCAPLTILAFFYLMATLEGKSFEDSTKELKQKFLIVYMGDWLFWPPVQFINFYFLPTKYRVLYINAATMIFDIYLAYMKHYKPENN